MYKVIILGCGDIGRRVAALWQAGGANVAGLVQSELSRNALKSAEIGLLDGDLDDWTSLRQLPINATLVYYFAPPPRNGRRDTRLRNWLSTLEADALPQRIVLISTTAVYGDSGGDWITEDAPLQPGTDRGCRRLDAETVLQDWSASRGVPVVILRVAGIYGPGRLPRVRLEKGLPVLVEAESGYTNRIHADDLAAICLAAARHGQPGAIYNVSDGQPGTMTQWFNAVADHLSLPRPPTVSRQQAEKMMSEGMLSYLAESRRIDNSKMLNELKIKLAYPDLESGLADS